MAALTVTTPTQGQSDGPAIDRAGAPVIDPTENVKALAAAGARRADDLREAERRLSEANFAHINETTALRAAHNHELGEMRAKYDGQLRDAESKRIDAIRAVDVGAVNRAAEVSATQALTLASQVATSADTLRIQVGTTATAFDAKLAAALEPISKDIADLRRVQYEAVGHKEQVVDKRAGNGAVIAMIGVVLGLLGFGLTLVLAALTIVGFILANK